MALRQKSRAGTKSPTATRRRRSTRGAHSGRSTTSGQDSATARKAHGSGSARKTPARGSTHPAHSRRPVRKWSAQVTRKSDALDLEPGVFTRGSARQIALSLKRSAEASERRKSEPFRSAMSMLNFEINRGGAGLSSGRRRVLNQAKVELRKAFHRA